MDLYVPLGTEKDSMYRHEIMVLTKIIYITHGIDFGSWYRISTSESHTYLLDLKVPVEIDSWYSHKFMVLTTPIVFT